MDATGPYQDAPYTLAYNYIAARVPYIGLADAGHFVASFGPTLDRFARAMAVPALAGASSTPALSNAALDDIARGWTRADTVTVAIPPGNCAPRGHAVVRAILSYVRRLLGSLVPIAPAARAASRLLQPFGTDRGDKPVQAEGRDGPMIPTLPGLAMLRRIVAGRLPPPGTRPCVGFPSIGEIETEMRPYRIAVTRSLETVAPGPFQRALGTSFDALPSLALRTPHRSAFWGVFTGTATVVAPSTRIARLVARVTGLPSRGGALAARVTIARPPNRRALDPHLWQQHLRQPHPRQPHGGNRPPRRDRGDLRPFPLPMALGTAPRALGYTIMGWRFGTLRLPRRLAPAAVAAESLDDLGRLRFDVSVRLPLGLGQRALHTNTLESERFPRPKLAPTGEGRGVVTPAAPVRY